MANSILGRVLSLEHPDADAFSRLSGNDFDAVQLLNGGEIWRDVRSLVQFKEKVRDLRVLAVVKGFRGLDELTELVCLNLEDSPPLPVVDLSRLQNLRDCKFGWSPRLVARSFFSLPNLERISIYRYVAPTCSEVGLAKRLREATFRHGTIGSLEGVQGCTDLEILRLVRVRELTSISPLSACKRLRILDIDEGPEIHGLPILGELPNLEEVLLSGRFELESIEWMRGLQDLQRFRSDALVRSIDWTIPFSLPKLTDFATRFVPGSSLSVADFKRLAGSSGRSVLVEFGGTRRSPWVELTISR